MTAVAKPFLCQACWTRFAGVYQHRTLGIVCPACLRPMVPQKRKRKHAPPKMVYVVRRTQTLAIAERDGWICQLCGQPVEREGQREHRASVDHIIRRRDGGNREPSNLRLAHQSCNEYREGANVKPFAPPLTTVIA